MNTIYPRMFDYPVALERTGGDEEFLFRLVDIYRSDFKKRFALLTSAVENKDFECIHHQAHTLKGSSANLCLGTLQELSLRLEEAAERRDPVAARALLKKMALHFRRFLDYCHRERETSSPGVA